MTVTFNGVVGNGVISPCWTTSSTGRIQARTHSASRKRPAPWTDTAARRRFSFTSCKAPAAFDFPAALALPIVQPTPLGLAFQPSLRDSRNWRCFPRFKIAGYYRVSLRDPSGTGPAGDFGVQGRATAAAWERAHFGRSLAGRILSCPAQEFSEAIRLALPAVSCILPTVPAWSR